MTCSANEVVAADPLHERVADHRDRAEQVDDHLSAPVGHVAPRQQIAHEGLRHQRKVDHHAQDPQQFARRAVRPVHQCTEHVQVDDDEERGRAGRVQVADQPTPLDVAHDVFDRRERFRGGRLVVHRQEDDRDQLDRQHDDRERAEVVPEVEVLRCVVLRQVLFDHRVQRKAGVDPPHESLRGRGLSAVGASHLSLSCATRRSPGCFGHRRCACWFGTATCRRAEARASGCLCVRADDDLGR